MSWEAFVDDLMKEISPGRSLTAAAIIGRDGDDWAQSVNFPHVSVEEIEKLKNGFDRNNELAENGLSLGGLTYLVLRNASGEIHGTKGTGGTCVRKTTSAFIIGLYDEPCTHKECRTAVCYLGEYLDDQGI